MNPIREYPLASEEANGFETLYSLIFADDGQMVVRSIQQSIRTLQRGGQKDLQPSEFSPVQVNGVPLGKLVAQKLEELLPASPPKYPEYRTSL